MGTEPVSKIVGQLLYRLWPYHVGEQIPAGIVMPLRLSLRREYRQWLKPQYFLRPLENSNSKGLVIEILLAWEPSDLEMEILSEILAPYATEFVVVAKSIFARISLPKYPLAHAGLTRRTLRERLLSLTRLITSKALLLRSLH